MRWAKEEERKFAATTKAGLSQEDETPSTQTIVLEEEKGTDDLN